ncbi:unnamed protein product [Adineta steineri]|uniref:Uncharacterized protein n=1 Tax=Adineta steineri TaxID=433720 RepID=A0A819JV91_9BILA|nr:unnamed protein product [Adineta steineri]CAF1346377.1 unnamed protein product [Adineta steineri]CAF3571733.1 unnamed protein product [Adineta steineri]CAF3938793.1 unnamed protein product [Adineta steineri]
MNTAFPAGNNHRFTSPCASSSTSSSSSNHFDKTTTSPSTNSQITNNGFISFANTASGNPFMHQPNP